MDYYIGKVAKMMGMSVEGIRKYEKAGIINPKRSGDGEYRTYSYLDITSLIRGRMYRSFDFSLKEIEELTNQLDAEGIIERLKKRQARFSDEKELLFARENFLSELTDDISRIVRDDGKVQIVQKPAYFRIEFSENGEVTEDKAMLKTFSEWMQFAPFVHMSSRYHGEDVFGGIAIDEKYAKLFGLTREICADHSDGTGGSAHPSIQSLSFDSSEDDCMKNSIYDSGLKHGITYIPAGLCLRIGVKEDDNGFSRVECAERLKAFADEHKFCISMNLIGHTVIGMFKNSGYQRYRDICAFFSY